MKKQPPSTSTQTASRRTRKPGGLRKIIPYAIGAAILIFIVTGLLPKPISVDTAAVTRGPLTVTVLEEGETRIRHRYIVSPPVAGYLRRVPLRQGDPIVAGKTLLATVEANRSSFLDPRARVQAEAAVRSAEAARMQRSEQADSTAAELELAKKELGRAEKLHKTGAVAAQEYDTASNRVDVLENQLDSARFALQVAEFELEQAKAALMQAEGETDGKPVEIRSPVTGFVLNIYEESARVVTAGQSIMEVGDPEDIEAEIELLSTDAVNVKPGADVSIEQWGGPPLHGRVTVVEPGGYRKVSALGVEEQRVKVRINFTDLPKGVFGDRYRVEARIVTWHGDDVLQVPTGALFRRGNEWMAFVAEDGRAKLAKVGIDHNNGIAAEVTNGLSEGQQVILHPPDTLSEGAGVKPREEG